MYSINMLWNPIKTVLFAQIKWSNFARHRSFTRAPFQWASFCLCCNSWISVMAGSSHPRGYYLYQKSLDWFLSHGVKADREVLSMFTATCSISREFKNIPRCTWSGFQALHTLKESSTSAWSTNKERSRNTRHAILVRNHHLSVMPRPTVLSMTSYPSTVECTGAVPAGKFCSNAPPRRHTEQPGG